MESKTINYTELSGKPVVSMSDGIKVGTVKDILIDTENLAVTALLVSGSSGVGGLPYVQILAIGPDAVTIEDANSIFWASAHKPGPGREGNDVKGLTVVNAAGEALGSVHDIELFGDHVSGLEIRTGGLFGIGATDTHIPAEDIRSIGTKLVTVDLPAPAPAT